ncbi:MAG TPA: protein-glutamate O-methyltransferase CheR [Kofleriaceae bacterium]|nr:protein-glutamate O-methyltransferase CheR [Kofleriaceae bacterium]
MSAAPALAAPALSEREFQLFQKLVLREAGIFLGEHKRALVIGRLSRRLRELGMTSFGVYYDHVTRSGDAELVHLLDAICTNETHFFREPDHFSFLESHALREFEALAAAGKIPKRLRVWSAACSSGEEPYSLAMTLRARFPRESGWHLEILASDLSTRILDRARAATWPIEKTSEIPYDYLRRFMLRGTGSQSGKMKAGAEIRSLVEFSRINLNDDNWPVAGKFDLIFCRNVLIYFERTGKAKVARHLLDRLSPHGYLFLGHAETLAGLSDQVRSVSPSVYQLRQRVTEDC